MSAKHYMKDIAATYVGTDSRFRERLAAAMAACGVAGGLDLAGPADAMARYRGGLLIVEAEMAEARDVISQARRKQERALIVLAVGGGPEHGDNRACDETDLVGLCDDVLSRAVGPEMLDLKVRLYAGWLGGQAGRIAELESRLMVQDEVLGRIERISQLAQQINSLELEKIAAACIEQIPQLVSARFASLYAYDKEHGVLHLLHHNHPHTVDRVVVLSDHSKSLMAVALRESRTLLIEDLSRWPDTKGISVSRKFAKNYKSRSCVVAPLISGGKMCGVLNLADKVDGSSFSEAADRLSVELFCDMVASAISNAKLYEKAQKQAQTDSLTGLVNHSTFYSELEKEIHRSRRYGSSLSLAMIDLDELKEVNDAYGHLAGDAALRLVAEQITKCIRAADVVARYGGDEFAMVLPNTDIVEAAVVVDRLVKMVSDHEVQASGHRFSTSISVGVSQYGEEASLEQFMNEADSVLFDAKATGKNRMKTFAVSGK